MAIAIHAIIVAVILAAILVINKIVEIATASPTLAIARAKVTMLNTETILDQDQDPDQGPVLVILVPQGTIMVTTFTTMTIGEGSIHTLLLPSLV